MKSVVSFVLSPAKRHPGSANQRTEEIHYLILVTGCRRPCTVKYVLLFVITADESPVKAAPMLQHTTDPSLADSPSRKFTSALNTRTSVLNTADEPVSGSPLQLSGHAVASDELRDEVQTPLKGSWSSDEDSSDGSSASDHESESGTAGSSSDGEREAKMHQGGGKTLPGLFTVLTVLMPSLGRKIGVRKSKPYQTAYNATLEQCTVKFHQRV